MSRSSTRLPLPLPVLLLLVLVASGLPWRQAAYGADAPTHWVATWAASPQSAQILLPRPAPARAPAAAPRAPAAAANRAPGFAGPLHIDHQTVRMVVRTSIGGPQLRVQLSNAFGSMPLEVGAAHIALSAEGSAIMPGSDHTLTFSGERSIVIPTGAEVLSDPVDLQVPPLAYLAISVYVDGQPGEPSEHLTGLHTTYVSGAGDFTGAASLPGAATRQSWYWLSGVDVLAPRRTGLIVAFGDSITDGVNSTPNTDRSWVGQFAQRLHGADGGADRWAVVDEGISGNRLLHDQIGPAALARLDRDVFSQPGVRWMIVLEGINDIGFSKLPGATPAQAVTAQELIDAQKQIIARAHLRGIRVVGATLTPFKGATYYSEQGETVREAVNQWIRGSHAYDAVVDFDAVVRDPNDPKMIRADFNNTDHLHPNDAGYRAMAAAIELSIFSRGGGASEASAR
jgi:lysophospholipase L1-like esterase